MYSLCRKYQQESFHNLSINSVMDQRNLHNLAPPMQELPAVFVIYDSKIIFELFVGPKKQFIDTFDNGKLS